jgi:CDP-diacylglycerol--glycerol-3-phosphate 3-phosphatidyltransferase
MRREFWTPSNVLSLSRPVLAIVFAFVMLSGHPDARPWGAFILFLTGLTDRYDGILARKLHQETEWGRILDPLADKIAAAVGALVLLLLGDLPLWFLLLLVVRDLLILAGGLFLKARKGVVLPSNETGKWAMGIIALTFFILILGGPSVPGSIGIWLSAILCVVSFAIYSRRFTAELRRAGGG